MKIHQISLFVENKSGAVNAPLKLLSDNGINISTLSLADSKSFGILRLLIRDWERARDLLEKAGFAVKVTEVVALEVDHAPGSLSRILDVLDKHNVNIEYLYAFAAGYYDKAAIIFRFDDPDAAIAKVSGELAIVDPKSLFAVLED